MKESRGALTTADASRFRPVTSRRVKSSFNCHPPPASLLPSSRHPSTHPWRTSNDAHLNRGVSGPFGSTALPHVAQPSRLLYLSMNASDPEVMRQFYNRLFPWKQLFTWLNHDHGRSLDPRPPGF